mgnify:CR=1 FL=1
MPAASVDLGQSQKRMMISKSLRSACADLLDVGLAASAISMSRSKPAENARPRRPASTIARTLSGRLPRRSSARFKLARSCCLLIGVQLVEPVERHAAAMPSR